MCKGRARNACLLVVDSHHPPTTLESLVYAGVHIPYGVLQARQLNRDDAGRFKTYAPHVNIPRLYHKWLRLLLTRRTLIVEHTTTYDDYNLHVAVFRARFENKRKFRTVSINTSNTTLKPARRVIIPLPPFSDTSRLNFHFRRCLQHC